MCGRFLQVELLEPPAGCEPGERLALDTFGGKTPSLTLYLCCYLGIPDTVQYHMDLSVTFSNVCMQRLSLQQMTKLSQAQSTKAPNHHLILERIVLYVINTYAHDPIRKSPTHHVDTRMYLSLCD
jgi:hypothetical protein